MDRSRPGRAALFLILAVLAFGLGACGEDAAPAVTPPAPLPAPPPFEPQAVEVPLGASGSTVTLMTTRTGGFTLDGDDFTGGDVEAENGNAYTLALADGDWSATFVPVVVEVALGASGDVLTVSMLEDRTYEAGGRALAPGETRSAMNGNAYRLTMADGAWTATYEPALASVGLGTSGASVTLSRAEDGGYSVAHGTMVASVLLAPDGTPVGALAENGNAYALSIVDGEWRAVFDAPDPVMVALGTSGDSVSIRMGEDRSHTLDGATVADGHPVVASNGNEYALSMADGVWTASYVPAEQAVALGTSGTVVTLVRAEDRSYRLGDAGITDGSTALAENGSTYSLSMGADGTWTASWVPDDPVVHTLGMSGATISLQRLEDRSWELAGASGILSLSTDGATGTITVTAANGNAYRLTLADDEYGDAVFQAPAPVMVALGASGESAPIRQAEDGSYWHGSTAVSSGSRVTSSDGRAYTLTHAAGTWTASYDAPMITAPLGSSGQNATQVKAEDGSYRLGTDLVVSGETTTMATDGRAYRLSMGEDGMWTGTYVPATQTFAAGNSGIDVTAVQDEAGQWSFTHPLTGEAVALVSGMNYAVGTRTYTASMGEDGTWTATYVPREVAVALGMSGESVTLVVAEDGTHWLGADLAVSGEATAVSSVGVSYTLSIGEDGMWTATPTGNLATVRLGISGTAILELAEDGRWRHGPDLVADGSEIAAANGNVYRISMGRDGKWTAAYVPAELEVAGTGLVALANEDRKGYTIDGASLPESGEGDLTTSDGAMYRVHMQDGMLHGARYDTAQHGDSDDRYLGLSGVVDFVGDTRGTAANEAGTMLTIQGQDFPVAELLGWGTSHRSGDNFVAKVLEEVTKLHRRGLAYEALNQHLEADTYDPQIRALWTGDALQGHIDTIFGTGDGAVDLHTAGDPEPSADDALENLAALVTALAGPAAFAAATAEDGGGILEAAALSAEDATRHFEANMNESTAFYRTTENTRYGAYFRHTRTAASQDLAFSDASGTADDVGDHGVFWWGLIPDTIHRSHLPAAGTLHYTGGTLAVATGDGHDTPTVYEGVIDIRLSLTRSSVSAVVSDLRDMDANPLVMNFAEVDEIHLPMVSSLPPGLVWGDGGGTSLADGGLGESSADAATNPAMVSFREVRGRPRERQPMQGAWRGFLLGTGPELATAVVGDWWIAPPGADDRNTLTGSFGAERVHVPEPPPPPLPPLHESATMLSSVWGGTTAPAAVEDGELKVTIDPDDLEGTDNSVVFRIAIAGLAQGGQKTVNGMTHMARLQEFVAAQRRILLGWIALDATTDGNERQTNTGRNAVWRDIRAWALRGVFGIGSQFAAASPGGTYAETLGFMPATYPGARNAADTESLATAADDAAGLAFLDRLEAAIGSPAGWEAARQEGGVFHDDANGRNYQACNDQGCSEVSRDLEAGSAVFGRREERLFVGFDTTDYTRFGSWRREYSTYAARGGYETDNSTSGDIGSRNNGFAFSPLAAAAYAGTDDPAYPIGTATYRGKTEATQDTTRWAGNVGVLVNWDAGAVAGSDATVVISDLVSTDGLPATHNGSAVRELIFAGTDNVALGTGDNLNEVTFSSSALRVRYQDGFGGDGTETASVFLDAAFVGKGLHGPRAVIGTWRIGDGSAVILNGARQVMVGGFGADLTGVP